jgi:hypothetical protein
MSSYPQRVADNILPLSISGELSEAFTEWSFTEITEDHEDIIENCQLCNQEQLRYHFEIENKYTQETLMVGSSCILKFNVAVYEKNIDHTASFFKITLKKNIFKEHLEEMETFKVHNFWKALSSSQKKLAIEYGHVEPHLIKNTKEIT